MVKNIEKKVNNSHVMWFGQSNRWVQLEEPAWFVNRLYQKGIDNYIIARKCALKYNLSKRESNRFVDEICTGIAALTKPAIISSFDPNSSLSLYNCSFVPYTTRYYLIRNKKIAIAFETRLAEYYIHPSLAHLETGYSEEADIRFEIFNHSDMPVLMEKNRPETAALFEDFTRLKKRLFISITNTIYLKTNNDWMSFVHASAITDGKQTLLLSSASGSGKSSMAALLQTKGLQLVSDDFVPIDVKNKHAFPFPAAITVKQGTFDLLSPYYGNLQNINFNRYEYTHRSVRYLPPNSTGIVYYKAQPVKNIVFIRYNPQVSCNFKCIPSNESLKLFHEQAWVSGNPQHAKSFINWFVKLHCYALEYGDTEAGIQKVLGIFNSG